MTPHQKLTDEEIKGALQQAEMQLNAVYNYKELGNIGVVSIALLQLHAENKELRETLQKIADKNTLDGEKYNSFEQGWNGVAAFAEEILKKVEGKL